METPLFHPFDRETWPRSAHFDYYLGVIRCRYNLGADLDMTNLQAFRRSRGLMFFPVMLYVIMRAVNGREEFRMTLGPHGEPGFWDVVHPCYTLFHPENETFTDIWSEYSADFSRFYDTVTQDMARYRHVTGTIKARASEPPNICPVSSLPWLTFTHFAQDSCGDNRFLSPLIKFGRYETRNGRTVIPVSVSVHHAAADGFHTCRLINDMQRMLSEPEAHLGV